MKTIHYIVLAFIAFCIFGATLVTIINGKTNQVKQLKKEKEQILKRLDSLNNVSQQLQHEGDVLLRLYKIAKKDREEAMKEANEAQKKLRHEKNKPVIRYTHQQLDSIRAVHFR